MNYFFLNGQRWNVWFVPSDSYVLTDRTGLYTVATTDPTTHNVYMSDELKGDFLIRVFLHELGHCCMISFNLIGDIHRMIKPQYWIEAEEWLCNFIADYGRIIFSTVYSVLGYDAIEIVPYELEQWIA